MKRVLAIVCLVISLGVFQGHGKSFEDFFSSTNNLPYRTLLRFAHPTSTFVSGYCYEYDDYIKVSIYSISEGTKYNTIIRLYLKNGIFSRLVVQECTDAFPCFLAADFYKIALEDIFSDYQSDTLKYLERLYGKRLSDMDAKEVCTVALSLLLLSY